MSSLRTLFKHRFQCFTVSYSTKHQLHIPQFIVTNRYHPLYITQTRLARERPKTGLWWHVVATSAAADKPVVKNWVRRRLNTAFNEELRARGIEEDGKITNGLVRNGEDMYAHSPAIQRALDEGHNLTLSGGLKLNAMRPAVATKYKDVKRETGMLIDLLLQNLSDDLASMQPRVRRERAEQAPRLPHASKGSFASLLKKKTSTPSQT